MFGHMESSVFALIAIVIQPSSFIFALENNQPYLRLEDTRVDHSTQQLDGLSVLQCGAVCETTDICVSLSYNSDARICQLNDKNPDSDTNCQVSSIPGWTSYYPPKSPCEDGWYYYDKSCYIRVLVDQDWETSEANCVTLGGHLVDIIDDSEMQFVTENFFDLHWIGLNKCDQNEEFIWSSGRMMTLDKFFPGEPSGGTCCSAIHERAVYGYGWNDISCSEQHKIICEREHYYNLK